MLNARNAACALYGFATLVLVVDFRLFAEQVPRPPQKSALERARARGLVEGLPRLAADDAMANAAVLADLLDDVPPPGRTGPGDRTCSDAPRAFAVKLDGRLSWVRFHARLVCQLNLLKQVSVAQPGFGARGLGEVGAFLLGRRLGDGKDVDVTRVVVPPFRFTRDTLTFVAADLGRLEAGERFIGTWHTHPESDMEQGALSETDLRFMRTGYADFHGGVGRLQGGENVDWLFDIVDPREGSWNVFAHDARRLGELLERCEDGPGCPVDELRLAGSRFFLLTRFYEERDGQRRDFWDEKD